MKINGQVIGEAERPYIIAELSANHNGSLETATRLIGMAKAGGADAVKLQTYTADTLTIDSDSEDFLIKSGLWKGKTLYELYQQAHTPWDWHQRLFEEAARVGITIFSSPFDTTAIELLERLGAPAYKIASFEANDLELIANAASTRKPLIISTGLASRSDIGEAVEAALSAGASRNQLALLHCLSAYPAPPEEYKLDTIPKLKQEFGLEVGLSDHTIGNEIAIGAVALGARIIEKHFTEDITGGGPDDSFSMDFDGLGSLRKSIDSVWQGRGFDNYRVQPSEIASLKYRRSLYAVRDIALGEKITLENVRSIRPGYGVAPKELGKLLGMSSPKSLLRGEPITQGFVETCVLAAKDTNG